MRKFLIWLLAYAGLWSQILSLTCQWYNLKLRGIASNPKSRKFFTQTGLQEKGYLPGGLPYKYRLAARKSYFLVVHGNPDLKSERKFWPTEFFDVAKGPDLPTDISTFIK